MCVVFCLNFFFRGGGGGAWVDIKKKPNTNFGMGIDMYFNKC